MENTGVPSFRWLAKECKINNIIRQLQQDMVISHYIYNDMDILYGNGQGDSSIIGFVAHQICAQRPSMGLLPDT